MLPGSADFSDMLVAWSQRLRLFLAMPLGSKARKFYIFRDLPLTGNLKNICPGNAC
jgi:hypothetical protein